MTMDGPFRHREPCGCLYALDPSGTLWDIRSACAPHRRDLIDGVKLPPLETRRDPDGNLLEYELADG